MSFEAKYEGDCENCDGHIEPGDDVMYVRGQFADALVHVACTPRRADNPYLHDLLDYPALRV